MVEAIVPKELSMVPRLRRLAVLLPLMMLLLAGCKSLGERIMSQWP